MASDTQTSPKSDPQKKTPTFNVNLELLEDYTFKVDFDDMGYIITDEAPPLGKGEGPNPSRLVATAVANCLAASLIFALSKKKQKPKNLKAQAQGNLHRVNGLWRIEKISVNLDLDTDGIADDMLKEVLGVFEDYCIVTQSIREGIPVSLTVNDSQGNKLS